MPPGRAAPPASVFSCSPRVTGLISLLSPAQSRLYTAHRPPFHGRSLPTSPALLHLMYLCPA
jgi:hypothetical protein